MNFCCLQNCFVDFECCCFVALQILLNKKKFQNYARFFNLDFIPLCASSTFECSSFLSLFSFLSFLSFFPNKGILPNVGKNKFMVDQLNVPNECNSNEDFVNTIFVLNSKNKEIKTTIQSNFHSTIMTLISMDVQDQQPSTF